VEEDLEVRSRGPKMTSKRMFESVLARVGEVSLHFGQGQTAGGESAEPQGMRRWCRCVFDRGNEGKRAI